MVFATHCLSYGLQYCAPEMALWYPRNIGANAAGNTPKRLTWFRFRVHRLGLRQPSAGPFRRKGFAHLHATACHRGGTSW